MREQFGILGLGQCGGNIASLFEQKQYTTVYLNTSKEDLNAVKGVHKIHIDGADGAAKDRRKVLQLATESFQTIIEKINSILTQKYILVLFSSSGGTGSGLSTPILRYLSQIGKVCIPVVVLPNETIESAKSCENAYNACAELISIQGLGSTFLLDNSNDDKFAINQKFVNDFDSFVNLKNSSVYGNIDMAERKQILSCPGGSVIGKVSKSKSTASEIMHSIHNGIYAKIESKIAYYLGISTSNKSLDISSLSKEFIGVYDVFSGISEATTIAIVSGLQWPMKRIERFRNKFEETVQNINNTIIQQSPVIQPLQGLSFMERQTAQPTTPVNPRDILLGLLNN
jgi:cell division GTPase FtsZ